MSNNILLSHERILWIKQLIYKQAVMVHIYGLV